jgi:hypothetical protein
MAIAVELIKQKNDDNFVYYIYRSAGTDTEFGEIKIDKKTGDTYLEKLAEGDVSEALARRASWALMKAFKKGEFPEKTWWLT